MTKNMSIILIAVIAAIMIAGTLAVTVTTGDAYANRGISQRNNQDQSSSVTTSGSNTATATNTNNGGNARG
jgi:cell division protein ZapA (FtsZ GTPase activity inhibitor)